jgi:hypothetical protein
MNPSLTRQLATAHHEAGHAVAAYFTGLKFRYVTIAPGKDSLGHLQHGRFPRWFRPDVVSSDRHRLYGERHIVVSFAGQLAEARFRGSRPRYGMHGDNQNAIEMAFHLCGSKKTAEAYLRYCWCLSDDRVDLRWREITALAAALIERETVSYIEVAEIIFSGTAALWASLDGKCVR